MKLTLFLILISVATVFSQTVKVITVTIDSATAVTDTIDLFDKSQDLKVRIAGIEVDTPWTDAGLSFLVGDQAGASATLAEAFEMDGTAITATIDSTVNNYIAIKPWDFVGIRFLQIRSGTHATPVNQGDTRTLKIYLTEY